MHKLKVAYTAYKEYELDDITHKALENIVLELLRNECDPSNNERFGQGPVRDAFRVYISKETYYEIQKLTCFINKWRDYSDPGKCDRSEVGSAMNMRFFLIPDEQR